MITTKLLRAVLILVVVVLLGIVAFEVKWSMDAKHDAKDTATRAADAAALVIAQHHDSLAARKAAEERAASEHTQLVTFSIETTGEVRVTVNARAKSYLLRHFSPTRSISEITVTGSSDSTTAP
jgi:hypothetical protein